MAKYDPKRVFKLVICDNCNKPICGAYVTPEESNTIDGLVFVHNTKKNNCQKKLWESMVIMPIEKPVKKEIKGDGKDNAPF